MARKKTSRKGKYQKQQARANYRREHRDKVTVTTWTDTEAGNTPEERIAHWAETREDRYENDPTMRGYGTRQYNALTGEVEDVTCDSIAEAIASMTRDVFDNTPVSNDGSRQVSFPSLGVGMLDVSQKKDAEKARMAVALVHMCRSEIVDWPTARLWLAFFDQLDKVEIELFWHNVYHDTGYRRAA